MKLPSNEIGKIGILRALQLGDLLCAVPAFRAIRKAYPNAEISLISLPWAKTFVDRFSSYIDRFISFPGYPGLPEQEVDAHAIIDFIQKMQEEKFDLILQMQGNGTIVNSMISIFGSNYTAGFFIETDFCPNKELFMRYPGNIHEIERHLELVKYLGIPPGDTALEFPINRKDEQELAACQLPIEAGSYVCIHPGSRGSWRQWPVEYFAEVANECSRNNKQVVITGTKDELGIVEQVQSLMKDEPIIAAGKTTLGAVGVLIRDAYALVSNCTGVSHIAAALKTRSVVISMDGEPGRWAPLNSRLHKTIDWTTTPQFEKVFSEVKSLLQQPANKNSEELVA
jgi:ADP-heptose:LPS heptosyltransferase